MLLDQVMADSIYVAIYGWPVLLLAVYMRVKKLIGATVRQ